jgi:hypothetical protein
VDQDNLAELHRKYSHLLYGPDYLLKPLAVLQNDLETSGIPRQDRLQALRLAMLYWADATHGTVPKSLAADPEIPGELNARPAAARQEARHNRQEVTRDRRARSPASAR